MVGVNIKVGGSTSAKPSLKKKENATESAFDLEQHFILRLPPGPAAALRQDVQTGAVSLKDKLSIEVQNDLRHGIVRYGSEVFSAKLMDSPCMMETLKTVDRKTFYKIADVMQLLICSYEDDTSQDENESPRKKDKDKKYHYPHGICPSLKNVRKRRFRKTLKKKYTEQPDIEKEVKRLFRMDAEAIDVKWEVLTEEEKTLSESNSQNQIVEASGTAVQAEDNIYTADSSISLDIEQVFGELSSSDDEDKDVNIMDSGEDEAAIMSRGAEAAQQLIDGLSQSVGNEQDSVLLSTNDTEGGCDDFSLLDFAN
ncbi:transcription initiation factor TFIID subunit 7-like [Octopus vulgaris]|uniref:Transcription initiation factor TFIID subunit 7-like n=2 Tax=Octopus TaxID=6643 RepID=A0AA36BF16_OCTVU|nr:transcription initiation factor TFIID subunit 7 [Octopus sinensis]CAI9732197.1 transcription initiation factor TFIID subunit 7-like [Octopus vulgaris]